MKKYLGLFLVCLLLIPGVVFAAPKKPAKPVEEVKEEVVTEAPVFSEDAVDSSVFNAGNTISNKKEVDGISGIAGNVVTERGKVLFGAYAGNLVNLDGEVVKDLFMAGNQINVSRNSVVGRDAYIAGNNVIIDADIAKNLYVAGTNVTITGIVNGDAWVYGDSITFTDDAKIVGTLHISEESEVNGMTKATYGKLVKEASPIDKEEVKEASMKSTFTDAGMAIISNFVVIIILLLVFKKLHKKLDKVELSAHDVIMTSLAGLGLMVGLPIALIIALCTGVLTGIALCGLAIYGVALYIGYLLAIYIVGHKVWALIKPKSNLYIETIIGVVLVKLVSFIPVVGGLVVAILLFYGFAEILKICKESI